MNRHYPRMKDLPQPTEQALEYLRTHDPGVAKGSVDPVLLWQLFAKAYAGPKPQTEAASERCSLIAAVAYCMHTARQRGAYLEAEAHARELVRLTEAVDEEP